MRGRFLMEDDRIRPARAKSSRLTVRILDHQVDVNHPAGVMDLIGDAGKHQRADRDRRDRTGRPSRRSE